MHSSRPTLNRNDDHQAQYALRRGLDFWQLTFEGRQASFKHELGALYVACLLREPPPEPIHGVALALKARESFARVDAAHLSLVGTRSTASPYSQEVRDAVERVPTIPGDVLEERTMGLEDAAKVRALWHRQRELERVLADRLEIEPVKAEALAELEEVTDYLRQSPWLSRHGAERCAQAVAVAIKRLQAHLAAAVDAEGRPDMVLRAFTLHLHEYLLVPSVRGDAYARAWAAFGFAGCFIYQPPRGVGWEVQSLKSKVQSLESGAQGSAVQGSAVQRPAAVDYLSSLLSASLVLALFATGCAGPRPLRGGKALTTRNPAGIIEQSLVQGENPSQPTRQAQETIKLRTYTVPAGSRIEESQLPVTAAAQPAPVLRDFQPSTLSSQPPRDNPQPSTTFLLAAPMHVVEREETRARTELGAAQKDTARELGAKLASLKGMVWVGVGLFVFGLASLVWPPLKVLIGSVTTSAALMLGGLALIVLPSLIVGNELLILGVVALAVGAWFLAHRHGHLRGLLTASTATPPAPTDH